MPPKKPAYADDISDREWALLHCPVQRIPEAERDYLRERLVAYGQGLTWRDHCGRVEVTFRGSHAYVEAWMRKPVEKPDVIEHFEQSGYGIPWEHPFKLMRLGYIGKRDDWLFGFFRYSNEKYHPSFFSDGSTSGTPEAAFDIAAWVYLKEASGPPP